MVSEVLPSPNVAESAKLYEIDSRVLLRAYRRSEEMGLSVIGVFIRTRIPRPIRARPTWPRRRPDVALRPSLTARRAERYRSFHVTEGVVDEEQISIQPLGPKIGPLKARASRRGTRLVMSTWLVRINQTGRDEMTALVRIPTVLRPAMGGDTSVTVEGSTVGEVLDHLTADHPDVKGQLLTATAPCTVS